MSRYIATGLIGWMAISAGGSFCLAADAPATQAVAPEITAIKTDMASNTGDERHFSSELEGIDFIAPPTCQKIQVKTPDGVVSYASEKMGWTITVSRLTLPNAQSLDTIDTDKGKMIGIADQLLDRTLATLPGSTVLRNDPSNAQSARVRLIVIRYGQSDQPRLLQQAIIQANSRVFYTVQMVSESTSRAVLAEGSEDPAERQAAEAFGAMFDTVKILDRTQVRAEQDKRLLQTRMMMINFNRANVEKKLQKERYLRYERDGRDVGWEFESEDIATQGNLTGVRIWKASHLVTGAETHQDQIFSAFASFDRKYSIWERRSALFDGKRYSHFDEVGTADHTTELRAVAPESSLESNDATSEVLTPDQGTAPGTTQAPRRPGPRVIPVTRFVLNVSLRHGSSTDKPLNWELPPEYLSECMNELLPRMVAGNDARGLMFLSYVSQQQSLMLRYIDVMGMQKVSIDHTPQEAYVIAERIGLTGQPVMHYVSLNGQYLGSMSKQKLSDGSESVFWTLPTDAESIRQRWPDAQLSLPLAKERGVLADSKPLAAGADAPTTVPANPRTPTSRRAR